MKKLRKGRLRRTGAVDFYKDAKKEWRWRIISINGRIIADCSEGYKTVHGAKAGLKAVYRILQRLNGGVPVQDDKGLRPSKP